MSKQVAIYTVKCSVCGKDILNVTPEDAPCSMCTVIQEEPDES